MATQPCLCGHLGRTDRRCGCTPAMIAHYRQRVSGPLLDRFDLQVGVPAVARRDLVSVPAGEPSAAVADRVAAARALQAERFAGAGSPTTNAAMTGAMLRRFAAPAADARRILDLALRRLGLSARAHDGILRVARTIADLDGAGEIRARDVAEAVQYRAFDREGPEVETAAP